ncbi:methyl-accepting chemotaxis protein [Curvibacter sp. CHRR-16]|uniref:methyl-accepting chemotaxis protein n=1 Tax=Curvibacter sp. CHRR-16 TaxID=2835872 RepID=UPI001BDB1824|nr:PAS domain-containing methyl-accepting chemotaxis protein [Curvibacter sp. CHRR-16]MBT0571399.1 methyl-accepting chemotaxis protein [Curvibacter sp. CHRR-16]
MRQNLPVTQQEYNYSDGAMLVSMTDTQGRITHCNPSFVETSGFEMQELIGQPHNMIRHPDMPEQAFKDMWRTIGSGSPWTGLVKNRRQNGDHYWVRANVTPLMKDGKPQGYMSVRTKPSRNEVQAAEQLYAQMRTEKERGVETMYLQAGKLHYHGLRKFWGWIQFKSINQRITLALLAMIALGCVPDLLGMSGSSGFAAQLICLLLGAGAVVYTLYSSFSSAMDDAQRFASAISSCNLTLAPLSDDYPEPVSSLVQVLNQTQINLRAVLADVRTSVHSFGDTTNEIASGGMDLANRTSAQAISLDKTSNAMGELSNNVQHTVATAENVAVSSQQSILSAQDGSHAVAEVARNMQQIDQASNRMRDIIGVIEGIAFQTNILALNAAVEAARAGEQGRGFAVVASEVRALAQRSASSAKEIRDLIAQTADQISVEYKQMVEAGQKIDALVASVSTVGNMIQDIIGANREQADGIATVNASIGELDSVTQQNAALAEESAAAIAALRNNAQAIMSSLQVFTMR